MPSSWYLGRQQDLALLERRKGLLGRSRVGALTATFGLVALSVLLTSLLFYAVAHVGSDTVAAPHMSASSQGPSLQVTQADPLPLSSVLATLSVPGRIGLNGPASHGLALGPDSAVAIGDEGSLRAGDTLRICTNLPAANVRLQLVDAATGSVLNQQSFAAAPLCGP